MGAWASGAWATGAWATGAWAEDGAPDVTAPTVSSWTIAADGLSSSIVHSEAVTRGADGITGLVLTPTNGGAAVTLSYTSGDGTNTLVIGHSRAVSSTETFTRSYTQPGDGIKDTASPANVLASFSDQAVTNNSTVNAAPSDITITNYTISVSAADGAQLGILSAVDADVGDSFTWELSVGTGDTNNSAVAVGAATGIVTVNSASTLGVGSYTFRVTATDSATNTYAEAIAFNVVSSGRLIVMSPVQSPIGDIVVTPVVS